MTNDSVSSNNSQNVTIQRKWLLFYLILFVCCAAAYFAADWYSGLPATAQASFVGRESCVKCHTAEAMKFEGSHHDKAMDLATPETVLGDFNNAELTHYGITSRMFQRENQYWVHTEGPDGKMADFPIKYVFGVEPLQQYMVEFEPPQEKNAIGRVQVLRVSWDTQRKRWFHLDPPDVKEKLDPADDLHWTGVAQRWNNMCADCHSTNFHKNYDPHKQQYHTTFSEIDVSCEACHGPGSLHVQLAEAKSPFWDRRLGYAIHSSHAKSNLSEIETCAPCHARRQIVHGDFRPGQPFYDYFVNEPLQELSYYADGQNLDEVYEYGSFTQSKMFHKNIRCSDCHDPHTTKLKFSGNQVCTSCHAHAAGKYDTVAHHHHKPGTPGAACVECHMPHTKYMEVDARRDHGLRVPRPDLSVKYGTPNACTQCHLQDDKLLSADQKQSLKQYGDWIAAKKNGNSEISNALDKINQYCAEAFQKWYPNAIARKEDALVPAITAARKGQENAAELLIPLVRKSELPDISRATVLLELGAFTRPNSKANDVALAALHDSSPQVRIAAIMNVENIEPYDLRKNLVPLLTDPVRAVRAEAARALAKIEREHLRSEERKAFKVAIQEFYAQLEQTNDRGASHLSKGVVQEQLGEIDAAEASYRLAMRVERQVTGPRSNLAALLEQRVNAQQQQAAQLIQSGDAATGQDLMQKTVLWQTEIQELRKAELKLFERDAKLAPQNGSIQYRLGLLYYLHEKYEAAEIAMRKAVELEPSMADFALTLALFLEKQDRSQEAIPFAQAALKLWPNDVGYQETLARLRGKITSEK